MSLLFVNAAFRDGSRTLRMAEEYLEKYHGEIEQIQLGDADIHPLTKESLREYTAAVANSEFTNSMFDYAKQFREADEIVIASPFWNYSIPAVLHAYFELVCSQGVTFDLNEKGEYYSLCKAKKLTYITTAGGYIPEVDHAYGYIQSLAEVFWQIPEVQCIKAEGLDV